MKILQILILMILITSCTVSPKVTSDPDNRICNLETKKRTLRIKEELKGEMRTNDPIVLVIAAGAAIYTTVTAVVSGSVVLIGNTIHWLEKQGKCDDTLIRGAYIEYIKPLVNNGGIIVEPANDK